MCDDVYIERKRYEKKKPIPDKCHRDRASEESAPVYKQCKEPLFSRMK